MTADILTNIHNKLTTFSKGQRRIATYILESYDKAAFLTAGALGKITQVSESTVVRFAAELGYDGYPAMQRALQEMVLNRLTSVQRIEVTDERLGEQDVVSTILQADMDRLRHTNEHLDREAFSGAVEALLQARYDAKKAKDFTEADRIRDDLKAMGVEITDIPGGVRWKR